MNCNTPNPYCVLLNLIVKQVVEVYWLLHLQLGLLTERRRDEVRRIHQTDHAVEEAVRCDTDEDTVKPSTLNSPRSADSKHPGMCFLLGKLMH